MKPSKVTVESQAVGGGEGEGSDKEWRIEAKMTWRVISCRRDVMWRRPRYAPS